MTWHGLPLEACLARTATCRTLVVLNDVIIEPHGMQPKHERTHRIRLLLEIHAIALRPYGVRNCKRLSRNNIV